MKVWRISSEKYLASPLDGEGARRRGGRWNTKGTPLVYASGSEALATLEALVYAGSLEDLAAMGVVLLPLDVPDAAIERLDVGRLPPDWRRFPYPSRRSASGMRGQQAALRSPCKCQAPAPLGTNVLLNPAHPDVAEVVVGTPVRDAWALAPRTLA